MSGLGKHLSLLRKLHEHYTSSSAGTVSPLYHPIRWKALQRLAFQSQRLFSCPDISYILQALQEVRIYRMLQEAITWEQDFAHSRGSSQQLL